jgi:hypothetical protein
MTGVIDDGWLIRQRNNVIYALELINTALGHIEERLSDDDADNDAAFMWARRDQVKATAVREWCRRAFRALDTAALTLSTPSDAHTERFRTLGDLCLDAATPIRVKTVVGAPSGLVAQTNTDDLDATMRALDRLDATAAMDDAAKDTTP